MTRNETERMAARARIMTLLERTPLLDGHNDLAYVIRNDAKARGDVRAFGLDARRPDGDTDIPRLRAGGVSAQIWAAFVPSESSRPAVETLEQMDVILRLQETHADVFHTALEAADIRRAHERGLIASILAVEGGVGLGGSLAPLRVWRAAGMRLMTLCHNGSLPWVDSATDAPRCGGLSSFGRVVVAELNRLGVIIDCSHTADTTMRQTLALSEAPIVFSHSNARALCGHARNVPDDVLALLAANDGLVMATFIPKFVSDDVRIWMDAARKGIGGLTLPLDWPERLKAYEAEHGPGPVATLAQVADHIEYLAAKLGASRVGIGSDFWGGPDAPVGLHDVSCFPDLLAELMLRGWSDDHIAALACLNFIRVFEAVERKGIELRRLRPPAIGSLDDFE